MAMRFARWQWIAGAALALAVAGNVAGYALLVQPLMAAQRAQQQRLLALQRKIRALQGQGKALEAQLRTLGQVEAYREELPERNRLVQLAGELTRLAATLSLKLPSVNYQPEPMKDVDLLRVRLTLGVEGPYGQLRRFLHELEKRRRYLVVERMALAEQRGTARTTQVAMQLTLAGYFR
ncbi:MAG TPA: type 4a pilus biogenesis protein PilO [Candidatus Sulfotelmatobacter sp.]|nr:type 4a pilus biogenesis protein PilO [Candidatus Sulfotelmatobacter sp.]